MGLNSRIWIYTAVFAGGAALSLLLTPLFGALARRTGFLDVPAANHKRHAGATPLLGGCAMGGYCPCVCGAEDGGYCWGAGGCC